MRPVSEMGFPHCDANETYACRENFIHALAKCFKTFGLCLITFALKLLFLT